MKWESRGQREPGTCGSQEGPGGSRVPGRVGVRLEKWDFTYKLGNHLKQKNNMTRFVFSKDYPRFGVESKLQGGSGRPLLRCPTDDDQ